MIVADHDMANIIFIFFWFEIFGGQGGRGGG